MFIEMVENFHKSFRGEVAATKNQAETDKVEVELQVEKTVERTVETAEVHTTTKVEVEAGFRSNQSNTCLKTTTYVLHRYDLPFSLSDIFNKHYGRICSVRWKGYICSHFIQNYYCYSQYHVLR